MSQETIISQSAVWLFGREISDIIINKVAYDNIPKTEDDSADMPPRRDDNNNFLLRQLRAEGARFARIYGFSYEGAYYDLPRPTIFLVHGKGIDPEGTPAGLDPKQATLSRMPADSGRTGLGTMTGSFAAHLKVWAYDRADFTVRLDLDTGSFDNLLLSSELDGLDPMMRSAGSVARSAGSVARSAGSVARAAGSVARARRSGAGGSD